MRRCCASSHLRHRDSEAYDGFGTRGRDRVSIGCRKPRPRHSEPSPAAGMKRRVAGRAGSVSLLLCRRHPEPVASPRNGPAWTCDVDNVLFAGVNTDRHDHGHPVVGRISTVASLQGHSRKAHFLPLRDGAMSTNCRPRSPCWPTSGEGPLGDGRRVQRSQMTGRRSAMAGSASGFGTSALPQSSKHPAAVLPL